MQLCISTDVKYEVCLFKAPFVVLLLRSIVCRLSLTTRPILTSTHYSSVVRAFGVVDSCIDSHKCQ